MVLNCSRPGGGLFTDPSGAKILGLFEGNTNKENAINMAAVASRT